MNQPHRPAENVIAQPGNERDPDEPPRPEANGPDRAPRAPQPQPEADNPVQPPQRPLPPVPRPQQLERQQVPALTATLDKLSLLERFVPEARDLTPQAVRPHFIAQNLYDMVYKYYQWRFSDIAYAATTSVAYIGQVDPCARRVALLTVNATVNKLIIANRNEGWNVNTLANPTGPAKGFLFPALAASIISAIGKTCPIWSGDTYYIPDLNDEIPALNDALGVAINNVHQFAANTVLDGVITRFCATGNIPMRSVDWKIPGGTPHWLVHVTAQFGRTSALVHANVHPDNFDPPNTLLGVASSCTALAANNCRYIIMKPVSDQAVLALISQAYEEQS